MNISGKDLALLAIFGLTGLLLGGILGFVGGVWAGNNIGYEDGIDAGIDYVNCLGELTPLYTEVSDEVIDQCWETYVYGSP